MAGQNQTVSITVFDVDSQIVTNAKVGLKPLDRGRSVNLKLDRRGQVYTAPEVQPGRYQMRVEAEGFEAQEREVQAGPSGLQETVILGRQGMPFYYRGKVKVPFEPPKGLLAVSLRPQAQDKARQEEVRNLARDLELEEQQVSASILQENVRVFRLRGRVSDRALRDRVQRLAGHPLIDKAGPVLRLDKESVSFLTDELIVKFKPEVSIDRIPRAVRELGLELERPIPYAGNAFLVRAPEASFALLDVCERLVQSGLVEYAEPNLVVTAVDDQVTPTDFLFAQQWHAPLVNLPEAWEALRNQNAPGVMPGDSGDLTFGSQERIIAVMDRGIRSQTVMGVTSSLHPDFAGTVTGGASKVYQFFDFVNMVPTNNAPPNNHGMGCAGVATALAENPSVVPGETEGVAGAAPNCQVMGLIRPAGGTELRYSDAYIWMGGFDPGSTQPGFPMPISPGADVITNSFGESIGAPISGLMRDCFDYLTTYGRGGKGVVICFSVGNGNTNFLLQRPWAAYEKTIAVAASTNTEVRAGYSNFGTGVDLCAPSSNGIGIVSCDLPGSGNLAGHTGGAMDYTNGFGGTSSATPLVAGVAALLLSVRPQLTWVEVRQILRDTAVKIDFANADPVGQWVDSDGDGVNDYSQWYGFGRLEAEAAVDAAIAYPFSRDVLVRDNLADTGAVPVGGTFWLSPDVWVRNASPAMDGAAALPASYAAAPPHQSPVSGQDNWVYVRVRNQGAADSFPFYVRVYLTHFAGFEFIYPNDYIPTNNPGDPVPSPLTTGTYRIGEVRVDSLAAGADATVNMVWPQALVPPETVEMNGMDVHWHPCLLVEVSPHDGPAASGVHVWDNNNLAQRNLTIVYPDDDGFFASGAVLGNRLDRSAFAELVVDRRALPAGARLFVEVLDRKAMEHLRGVAREGRKELTVGCCRLTFLDETRVEVGCADHSGGMVLTLPRKTRLAIEEVDLEELQEAPRFTLGRFRGREVLWLEAQKSIRIPVSKAPGGLVPIVLGGVVSGPLPQEGSQIHLTQRDERGRTIGGVSIELRKRP